MSAEIYALLRDDGDLCYVGQACSSKQRRNGHWKRRNDESSPLYMWMRTLSEPPDMRVLAIVEDSEADRTEMAAIVAARKALPGQLLNVMPRPPEGSPEWNLYADAYIGREVSPQARENMSAAAIGREASDSARAAMSAAALGHEVSAATRTKISASKMGHEVSPKTRAAISAGVRARSMKGIN